MCSEAKRVCVTVVAAYGSGPIGDGSAYDEMRFGDLKHLNQLNNEHKTYRNKLKTTLREEDFIYSSSLKLNITDVPENLWVWEGLNNNFDGELSAHNPIPPFILNLQQLRKPVPKTNRSLVPQAIQSVLNLVHENKTFFKNKPGMRELKNEMVLLYLCYFLSLNKSKMSSIASSQSTLPNVNTQILQDFEKWSTGSSKKGTKFVLHKLEWMLSNMPVYTSSWAKSEKNVLYLYSMYYIDRNEHFRIGDAFELFKNSPSIDLSLKKLSDSNVATMNFTTLTQDIKLDLERRARHDKKVKEFYTSHEIHNKTFRFAKMFRPRVPMALRLALVQPKKMLKRPAE